MSLGPICAWPMRQLLGQGRDENDNEQLQNTVFEDNKENERNVVSKGNEEQAVRIALGPALCPLQPSSAVNRAQTVKLQDVFKKTLKEEKQQLANRAALGPALSPQQLSAVDPARKVKQQNVSAKAEEMWELKAGDLPLIPAKNQTGSAEYSVGDVVEYRSGTHGQWMTAQVTGLNFDGAGVLTSYDLDVKRKAQADRMRTPVPSPSASAVPVPAKLSALVLRTPDWNDMPQDNLSNAAALALDPFSPGDIVEFWSNTYSQWMIAKVEEVLRDKVTYNLDVKQGAHRSRIRARAEDFTGLKKMQVDVIALS